jgi:hypothetical protein
MEISVLPERTVTRTATSHQYLFLRAAKSRENPEEFNKILCDHVNGAGLTVSAFAFETITIGNDQSDVF